MLSWITSLIWGRPGFDAQDEEDEEDREPNLGQFATTPYAQPPARLTTTQTILPVLYTELRELGIDLIELGKLLVQSQSIVQGSVVIQSTFVNPSWKSDSVDIYTRRDELDPVAVFENALYRWGYREYKRTVNTQSTRERHTFAHPEWHTQINITVIQSSSIQAILEEFPLNIQRLFWNGTKIGTLGDNTLSNSLEFTSSALQFELKNWPALWSTVAQWIRRGFKADLVDMFFTFQQSADRAYTQLEYGASLTLFLKQVLKSFTVFQRYFSDAFTVVLEQYDGDDYEVILGKWMPGHLGTVYKVQLRTTDSVHSYTICVVNDHVDNDLIKPLDVRRGNRDTEIHGLTEMEQEILERHEQEAQARVREMRIRDFERQRDRPQLRHQWDIPAELQATPGTDESGEEVDVQKLTCYDTVFQVTDEPQSFTQYVNENPVDHIFLLLPPQKVHQRWGSHAICYTRSALNTFLNDDSSRYFPCLEQDGEFDGSNEFIKVPLGNLTVFVPVQDIRYVLDKVDVHLFQVRESGVHIPYTASFSYGAFSERVGTDHCQQGTDKRIYRIRGVRFRE